MGWYCEVPRELYDRFMEKYPTKGAKRRLTIMAIKAATEERDDNTRTYASP